MQESIIPSQGFLAKDLQTEALCKLDKRVKATIEQFMKILEEIDTLVSKYSAEKNYISFDYISISFTLLVTHPYCLFQALLGPL